jgi:hypothetical protein
VRIVGVPKGKDVSDWFAAGGTPEDLQHLVSVQPALTAGALKTWCTRCGLANEEREHQAARPEPGSLTTRCLSDIEAKPVCWLWPGRIARGKLTILAGDPGLGKSQIAASIAAIVTAGGCWPVDRQRCAPADVLFLSAEDDPADTLRRPATHVFR